MTGYTGLNGVYVMVLPPGTYKIRTFLQGYVTQSTNVTVASGQLMLLDFIIRSQFAVSPAPMNTIIQQRSIPQLAFHGKIG
jgi:hypothetical protein